MKNVKSEYYIRKAIVFKWYSKYSYFVYSHEAFSTHYTQVGFGYNLDATEVAEVHTFFTQVEEQVKLEVMIQLLYSSKSRQKYRL